MSKPHTLYCYGLVFSWVAENKNRMQWQALVVNRDARGKRVRPVTSGLIVNGWLGDTRLLNQSLREVKQKQNNSRLLYIQSWKPLKNPASTFREYFLNQENCHNLFQCSASLRLARCCFRSSFFFFHCFCRRLPRQASMDLKRHSSWGPSPKLNGDVNRNGMQV